MHTFVIAEHPEFGKIRTVEKDGKIWFCAKDVAASLGYANTRDAIDRHCKPKGVCVHDIPTRGGRQKIKFIDEGNVYINPEKPDVPLNKNDAFQKVQKRRVQEKR